MTNRDCHWKVERIAEKANNYCYEQTDGNWSCLDWFCDHALTIQDEIISSHAFEIKDNGDECLSDDEIVDTYFDDGDWDDIEDYLFAEAERQIEWYEEYGKKELAE